MEKATRHSAIIIGKYPNQQKLTRRFLGNINPKTTIEKKELEAYLKGKEYYTYKNTGEVIIGMGVLGSFQYGHLVRQEYFYQSANN